MKIDNRSLMGGIAILLIVGCTPSPPGQPAKKQVQRPATVTAEDALVQFSLVAALAAGDYDDGIPLRQLLAAGDFGVGTFNDLNGEMIVLDGKIYQALADGSVRPAHLAGTSPFASVTFFQADGHLANLAAASLDDLDKELDRILPRRNLPYAIRIEGDFTELTLRSVPPQSPPFEPLVDVVKHQVTWQHRNVRGTLVGLRCPAWIGTLNVSGYHWHFLSDNRNLGGHVLACKFTAASLQYDECTSLVIQLPQSKEFDSFDETDIQKNDIDRIERQHSPAARP